MISSLQNKTIKELTKLHQKKYRKDTYLLLDNNLLHEAYKNDYLKMLLYVDKAPFTFSNSLEVSQEVMDKVSKKNNLKSIGVASFIKENDDYQKRVVILDELQDPLNVGRIMEAAYLFGFDSIVLSKHSADIYHEKCLNASKGAIFNLNIIRNDLEEEISKLKALGFKIYATGLKAYSIEMYQSKPTDKLAIILGNEGSGVEEKIMNLADEIIKIDMHNIDSLNVAMAGSILMHYFKKL